MSYDIAFRVKVEGIDYWLEPLVCDANITWNVKEMIQKSTGLDWINESDNGLCVDVIPFIEHGIEELEDYPSKYKPYEAFNGWGTVEGTIRFFYKILRDWKCFKENYPELVPLAHFWIY